LERRRHLNFWLNITTSEAPGTIDRLFIEVRNMSGTLLGTLATFSNVNSGTAGVYVLRGRTASTVGPGRLCGYSSGTNDITLPTSFRVDDKRFSKT
jgi:hypothetical protein